MSDGRTSDGRPKLQSNIRDRDHAKVAMLTVGDVSGTRYYAGYSGDWQTPKPPRLCKSMKCLLTD